MGWKFPWFSSSGSDFNYDFQASLDESVAPAVYNVSHSLNCISIFWTLVSSTIAHRSDLISSTSRLPRQRRASVPDWVCSWKKETQSFTHTRATAGAWMIYSLLIGCSIWLHWAEMRSRLRWIGSTTISTTTRSSVFINCCWEGQLDGFEGFSPGHPWSYILRSKNYLDLHCSEDLPNLWKLRQFQISEVLLWSLPNKSLLGLSIG